MPLDYDSTSLAQSTARSRVSRFTTFGRKYRRSRPSSWSPSTGSNLGSIGQRAIGKVLQTVMDPIMDRRKLKFLRPILDRARSLTTEEEWVEEVKMRLSDSEAEHTGKVLEALRCV